MEFMMGTNYGNFRGAQGAWEKMFAWRPIKVNKHWYWLREVYRRERNKYVYPHQGYEYGTFFDVIRDSQ